MTIHDLYGDNDITAITRSHLIIGRNLQENASCSSIDDFDMTKNVYTRRYKYLKITTAHFWNRFSQEYLNSLCEDHIYNTKKYDSFTKPIDNDTVIMTN